MTVPTYSKGTIKTNAERSLQYAAFLLVVFLLVKPLGGYMARVFDGGENTMSYFSQVVGLAGQNFLAGAAGLALGIAFVRGLARRDTDKLGSFRVDLTRAPL